MGGDLDRLVAGKPPVLVAVARALAATIEGSEHTLDSSLKWGALTYALAGDFHHWICSVSVTQKRTSLTFHFGGILEDPDGHFVAGRSKLLRRIDYTGPVDVEPDVVLDFLESAVARYPSFKEHWRQMT